MDPRLADDDRGSPAEGPPPGVGAVSARTARVAPEELPADGPRAVVVERRASVPLLDQYREAGAHPPRVGRPLAALVRTPALASPDRVEADEPRRDGQVVEIDLHIRAYDGDLFANVETVVLVELLLPALEAGAYELRLRVRTTPFSDLDRPEDGGAPVEHTHSVDFHLAEDA